MAVFPTTADTTVGGTVPSVLNLQLGTVPSLGAFIPGVARTYTAQTTATVTSTAGNATSLTVADPDGTGRLTNGAFTLRLPVRVDLSPRAGRAEDLGRADDGRVGAADLRAGDRCRRTPAHRRLHQDARVHPFDRDAVIRCRTRVLVLNSVSTPRSSAESRGGSIPIWRAKSAPS